MFGWDLRLIKRIEVLVAIVLVVVMYKAYRWIPEIDPRTGVDVWGSLLAVFPVLIAAALSGSVAWLLQWAFFDPLTDTAEARLYERAANGCWGALGALVVDWLKWLVVFWLVFDKSTGG